MSEGPVAEVALTCPIVPLLDNVVLVALPETETRVGKVIIPVTAAKDTEHRASRLGVVVAVGPGGVRPETGVAVTPTVCVGDTVVYIEFGSSNIRQGGTVYTITGSDGVLATLRNEPATTEEPSAQ